MLILLLDAAMIVLAIYIVNQGQEMNFGPAIISALVITVVTVICVIALGPTFGLLSLAPVLVIAILVIWMVSGVPLGRAAIAGVIFMVYKVAISIGLSAMTA